MVKTKWKAHASKLVDDASKQLPERNKIRKAINERFDSFFDGYENGAIMPPVCVMCDTFTRDGSIHVKHLLTAKASSLLTSGRPIPPEVRKYYKYGKGGDGLLKHNADFLDSLLLSPRSCYDKDTQSFACCSDCRDAFMKRNKTPTFAIANNFWIGGMPDCLKILTEVEMAFLNPVKTHGYGFCFVGGAQKQLKGSLSYYKVEPSSIAKSAAMFDALGLSGDPHANNIVVVLHGQFTYDQYSRAKELCTIRPAKIVEAVRWLVENNEQWKLLDIDYDSILEHIINTKPRIVEDSVEVEESGGTNCNVEMKESFQIFFPDGTISEGFGGQENMDEYKNLVLESVKAGFKAELKDTLMRQSCRDYKGATLVNACIMQYPYGIGGMNDQREIPYYERRKFATNYLRHMSKISNPAMQTELYTLILYNMYVKQKMVESAFMTIRNPLDIKNLSEKLTESDVNNAIRDRQAKKKGTGSGHLLLGKIDQVAAAVPHTDEATSKIRKNALAMNYYFGFPSFFLTITPDDDNCFLIEVYAGKRDNKIPPVEDASLHSTNDESKRLTSLRLKYPGLSSINFELALEIILADILAWDVEHNIPIEGKKSMFGDIQAFTITIEEQGRRSLHAHIQIWLEWFNKMRTQYENTPKREKATRKKLKDAMCAVVDRLSSTELFGDEKARKISIDHECREGIKRTKLEILETPGEQQLRNLRFRRCRYDNTDVFVTCPLCKTCWSNEQFVNEYIKSNCACAIPEADIVDNKKVMKLLAYRYQADFSENATLGKHVVPIAYNHHAHNKLCFEKKKATTAAKKRKRSDEKEECRYRVPSLPASKTTIEILDKNAHRWYKWDGTISARDQYAYVVKRHRFDSFQNIYCPEISNSKLCCNTNIQAITPGPVGFYSSKYCHKSTQKDDTKKYDRVEYTMTKALSRETKKETDRGEAAARILAATFASQKKNIVGAPMAAYLLRNNTRFIFSHSFDWCPLDDIRRILEGGEVKPYLIYKSDSFFFRAKAMNYLCRPEECDSMCPFEYFSKMENGKREEGYSYVNTEDYTHPSYDVDTEDFTDTSIERATPVLLTFRFGMFGDAGLFSGSIMDSSVEPCARMEEYAEMMILLFTAYRNKSDLLHDGGRYTDRLRVLVSNGSIGKEYQQIMQNIQDANYNASRAPAIDTLEKRTYAYCAVSSQEKTDVDAADISEASDYEAGTSNLGNILEELGLTKTLDEASRGIYANGMPRNYDAANLLDKGSGRSGYCGLAKMVHPQSTEKKIIKYTQREQQNDNNEQTTETSLRKHPTKGEIIKCLFRRTTRKSYTFDNMEDKQFELLEANGSALSILQWSNCLGLDKRQRSAFEIFTSRFVLDFLRYSEGRGDNSASNRRIVAERAKLECLAGQRMEDQLICFLHGPGGSGKTTVIDLFIAYCRDYCVNLESDYTFTRNTVCVTAMTGVAATILLGETTHTACHIYKKKIPEEAFEDFQETMFLIIDEISFADASFIRALQSRMRDLKRNKDKMYGGVHIIFSGDFRQLEPINRHPLYVNTAVEFSDAINTYIELNGMHRFKDDPEWGLILNRFRDGEATTGDIAEINKRLIGKDTILPDNLKYAVYKNADRDAINTGLFLRNIREDAEAGDSLDNALLVFADEIKLKAADGSMDKLENTAKFFSEIGEDDCRFASKRTTRMDPVLKLRVGTEIMLTENHCVTGGQANGSRAIVEEVRLKENERPVRVRLIQGDININAVCASQVENIRLRHLNERIQPETFCLTPRKFTFQAKFNMQCYDDIFLGSDTKSQQYIAMSAVQLPVVINHCTTGHKLQGCTVSNILIHCWEYTKNWPYVLLSRVRTRSGLFLRESLSFDLSKYLVPAKLTSMIRRFRNVEVDYHETLEEYDELLSSDIRILSIMINNDN